MQDNRVCSSRYTQAKPERRRPLTCIPLYSSLDPPPQTGRGLRSFPSRRTLGGPASRKVIVSTNTAETSLTANGTVYVVDPGFFEQSVYNPRTRVEALLVSPISKASAKQRAGRAGRTKPGKCLRLYMEKYFIRVFEDENRPEILRSNLAGTILTLAKIEVKAWVFFVRHFPFLDCCAPGLRWLRIHQRPGIGNPHAGSGRSLLLGRSGLRRKHNYSGEYDGRIPIDSRDPN